MTWLAVLGNHRIYSKVKLAVTLNRFIDESHNCNIKRQNFFISNICIFMEIFYLWSQTYSQFRAMVLQTRSLEEVDKYMYFFLPLK